MVRVGLNSSGHDLEQLSSTAPRPCRVRCRCDSATRKMAIDGNGGLAEIGFEYYIGGLGARRRNASSSSRVRGTSPRWFSISSLQAARRFFALVR